MIMIAYRRPLIRWPLSVVCFSLYTCFCRFFSYERRVNDEGQRATTRCALGHVTWTRVPSPTLGFFLSLVGLYFTLVREPIILPAICTYAFIVLLQHSLLFRHFQYAVRRSSISGLRRALLSISLPPSMCQPRGIRFIRLQQRYASYFLELSVAFLLEIHNRCKWLVHTHTRPAS